MYLVCCDFTYFLGSRLWKEGFHHSLEFHLVLMTNSCVWAKHFLFLFGRLCLGPADDTVVFPTSLVYGYRQRFNEDVDELLFYFLSGSDYVSELICQGPSTVGGQPGHSWYHLPFRTS